MYARIASSSDWDLHVLFAYNFGASSYYDRNFTTTIQWENLHLDAFSHEFLNTDILNEIDASSIDSKKTEERLTAYSPDVLIVYGYSHPIQRRAMNWAYNHKIPVLMISDSELRSKRSPLKQLAKKIIIPRFMSKLAGCLSIGDANDDYYKHYGVSPLRLFRTPLPIDLDIYEDAWAQHDKLRNVIREKYHIKSNTIVISMVGKFERRKCQSDLIDAIKHLPLGVSNIVLLLIGSGPLEQELRNLAMSINQDQIIFSGFINPVDLPSYYATSDIYCHVSDYDPHPLAISEAIFMSCPVIASSSVGSIGPTDDIQVGANGLVYPTRDKQALADSLRRLTENPHMRKSFGESSRNIGIHQQHLANGEGLRRALIALGFL